MTTYQEWFMMMLDEVSARMAENLNITEEEVRQVVLDCEDKEIPPDLNALAHEDGVHPLKLAASACLLASWYNFIKTGRKLLKYKEEEDPDRYERQFDNMSEQDQAKALLAMRAAEEIDAIN